MLLGVKTGSASSALHAAYDHLRTHLSDYGAPEAAVSRDVRVHILNPMEANDPAGLGLGIFLAVLSALRAQPVPPGSAVIGDMSVQGSILAPDGVGEMVLLSRENGVQTLFVPVENSEDVRALPGGLVGGLRFAYFSTPGELAALALAPAKEAGKPH
jgi:ATP-dependent Lon protease